MKLKKPRQKLKESSFTDDNLGCQPNLECPCNAENVLPRWFPLFVVIATMGVRICYVYQPESWWILHPDEVFQSVEGILFEATFYPNSEMLANLILPF